MALTAFPMASGVLVAASKAQVALAVEAVALLPAACRAATGDPRAAYSGPYVGRAFPGAASDADGASGVY